MSRPQLAQGEKIAAEPHARSGEEEQPVHKTRPTQNKRARERAQADKRKEKADRRQQSKDRRAATRPHADGEDPDIAGIRPGPQPSPYGDLMDLEDEDTI
jgi:hypothetical protein